ncbi:putative integrase (plasmid) [Legionella adelaidensis]|uniref:Putative integrase n=1 Tax=Legionella adelaidensis TaxID=45056 RepID=A0A0W0R5R7_9GAMM|nr:phage integrase N-terminal domain-containing protein [Legionella adelaidensis]KTC66373.1 putative integrase [Legionella adelaidensis]VEH84971.1 putative integrase [Legionella adelaidensis]
MRKYSLRQAAKRYLKLESQGSYTEKKQRYYVIQKMVDDLFRIGEVPNTWQSLETQHVKNLVKFWKKNGLKDTTIMRHMTIIRSFLRNIQCTASGIDNQSLQLYRPKVKKSHLELQSNIWESFAESVPRLILALQTQFGLTFSESILTKPGIHTKDCKLWITREISFNSLDRIIPIRNEVQKEILADLSNLTNNLNLLNYLGYNQIRMDWNNALIKHSLPTNKSWRYLYARQMYKYLLPILGNYQTYIALHAEMGIKSRNTLWSYLNE